MNKKKFIQVFEYQKLRYDDIGIFRKHHFEAMVKFNELHQNKYFTIIHQGIRFGSYVGVIKIGALTIEILPKADKDENADKNLWQNVLLNMLKVCKYIQVESISETQLKKRHHSILDVYFELYLNEIERLVKKGLIKKYRKNKSNQNALKGKLLFAQNIQQNLIRKELFFCEHQVYDKNHLFHQILHKGLLVLKTFVNDSLKDKLNRLLFEFQDFENINIQKKHFDKIIIDRKNHDYQKAIDIAKIIILNYSPSLNYGNENLLTLLFDMNALWEEYIFRILQKHKTDETEVSFQNSDKFWENKRIRPDIVLKMNNETFVIDTKWKIVEANNPSDVDLKQMFVYNLHWKAEKTLLLYPKTNQIDSDFGIFHYKNLGKKCKLGFVNITDELTIKNSKIVANEVFEKLNTQNASPLSEVFVKN
jgi:5-methylcytosine-specific restriction enzyme subunit McrC